MGKILLDEQVKMLWDEIVIIHKKLRTNCPVWRLCLDYPTKCDNCERNLIGHYFKQRRRT